MKKKLVIAVLAIMTLTLSGCSQTSITNVEFDTSNVVYTGSSQLTLENAKAIELTNLKAETTYAGYQIKGVLANGNSFPVRVTVKFSCLNSNDVQTASPLTITSIPANTSAEMQGGMVVSDEMPAKINITEINIYPD